jgi:hypothetical protein
VILTRAQIRRRLERADVARGAGLAQSVALAVRHEMTAADLDRFVVLLAMERERAERDEWIGSWCDAVLRRLATDHPDWSNDRLVRESARQMLVEMAAAAMAARRPVQ